MRKGIYDPGLKQQELETNHSPQSRAEVKNNGAIPPLPHTFSRSDA
jgi:hypothetical protein